MRVLISTSSMWGVGTDFITTVGYHLEEYGHDVDVVQFSGFPSHDRFDAREVSVMRTLDKVLDRPITSNGRWAFNWVLYRRWRRVVRQTLREGDYDTVLSDRICATPSALAARDVGVPAVMVTTGPATVRYDASLTGTDKTPDFQAFSPSKKLQYPFIWDVHRWNRAAFQSADAVVAVSEYDAAITRDTFGVEPTVVYLPVPLDEFEVDDWEPRTVTMVNPRTENKGLDTFLGVARKLPDVEFQVAGSLYDDAVEDEIDRLDNVEWHGWVDDMAAVYRTTKLLLIPSKYEEGGPRVVAEAFVNGIPVLGSPLGGTPDYVGDGGEIVEDYQSVDAWTAAVERFLSDDELYAEASASARERAALFDLDDRIGDVEAVLRSTVPDDG